LCRHEIGLRLLQLRVALSKRSSPVRIIQARDDFPGFDALTFLEPYLDDRKGFMDLVLKPLQDKKETLYVLPNSAAKAHAERRYPHKLVKVVDSGVRGR